MPTASDLLWLYSLRLERNKTRWTPAMQAAIESLIEGLKSVGPDEEIEIDAASDRDPLARFLRLSTGELLGQIPAAMEGSPPSSGS